MLNTKKNTRWLVLLLVGSFFCGFAWALPNTLWEKPIIFGLGIVYVATSLVDLVKMCRRYFNFVSGD